MQKIVLLLEGDISPVGDLDLADPVRDSDERPIVDEMDALTMIARESVRTPRDVGKVKRKTEEEEAAAAGEATKLSLALGVAILPAPQVQRRPEWRRMVRTADLLPIVRQRGKHPSESEQRDSHWDMDTHTEIERDR